MPKLYDIVTLGDMCVDLMISGGDIVPRFGQIEQIVGEYTVEMGGSTCIFACQASRLGMDVGILGKVGADGFGQLVIRRLQEYGVDTQHVRTDPDLKTGLGVALCHGFDRAILTYPGSLNALTPQDIKKSFLASADHLHHGSYFLQDKLKNHIPAIFQQARYMGLSTSLDTNWDPDDNWNGSLLQAFKVTDIFLPNLVELNRITQTDSLRDGIKTIHQFGVPIAAVKLGDSGACVSDGCQFYHCQVIPIVGGDSVGTGDSFNAGFLAAWLRGLPLPDCLRLGCGCGRAVAGAVGGLAGQPKWDELLDTTSEFVVTEGWENV